MMCQTPQRQQQQQQQTPARLQLVCLLCLVQQTVGQEAAAMGQLPPQPQQVPCFCLCLLVL
jgi:hypothetical protein